MKKIVIIMLMIGAFFAPQAQASNLDRLFNKALHDTQASHDSINPLTEGIIKMVSNTYEVSTTQSCFGVHHCEKYSCFLSADINDYKLAGVIYSLENDQARIWVKTKKDKITDVLIVSYNSEKKLYDLIKLKA